mmetsp:Transcript_20432/g.38865  ORF Transcript_20432/g.38865 Transcript_20432/m.38865 type:complete len:234 (-) Transcript_20432:444-1145(-)
MIPGAATSRCGLHMLASPQVKSEAACQMVCLRGCGSVSRKNSGDRTTANSSTDGPLSGKLAWRADMSAHCTSTLLLRPPSKISHTSLRLAKYTLDTRSPMYWEVRSQPPMRSDTAGKLLAFHLHAFASAVAADPTPDATTRDGSCDASRRARLGLLPSEPVPELQSHAGEADCREEGTPPSSWSELAVSRESCVLAHALRARFVWLEISLEMRRIKLSLLRSLSPSTGRALST